MSKFIEIKSSHRLTLSGNWWTWTLCGQILRSVSLWEHSSMTSRAMRLVRAQVLLRSFHDAFSGFDLISFWGLLDSKSDLCQSVRIVCHFESIESIELIPQPTLRRNSSLWGNPKWDEAYWLEDKGTRIYGRWNYWKLICKGSVWVEAFL